MLKKVLVSLGIFAVLLLGSFVVKKVSVYWEKRTEQKELEAVWARRDAFYARFPPQNTEEGRLAILTYFDEHYPTIEELEASMKELKAIDEESAKINLKDKEKVTAQKKRLQEKMIVDIFDPEVELELGEVYGLFFGLNRGDKRQVKSDNHQSTSPNEDRARRLDKLWFLKFYYIPEVKSYFRRLNGERFR